MKLSIKYNNVVFPSYITADQFLLLDIKPIQILVLNYLFFLSLEKMTVFKYLLTLGKVELLFFLTASH